jgi:hypothetical protein
MRTRPDAGTEAMSNDEPNGARPRRERSHRYPGVSLAECLAFCESIENRGVDGLSAADIASALGYTNIKTNTFSARLSAARQFGLLSLTGDGYALTPLARELLHPVDPTDLPRLYRQALLKPPLYVELAERLGGKKVPEASILGNVLYHHYQIIAKAKLAAAEAFLDSARFAGALSDDQVFHPSGVPRPLGVANPAARPNSRPAPPAAGSPPPPAPPPPQSPHRLSHRPRAGEVRLDLVLWGADRGKTIRLRAPESLTAASLERFLQALQLLVRVEGPEPSLAGAVEEDSPLDDPQGLP